MGSEGDVALDSDLVWKHFGKPDDWDSLLAGMTMRVGGHEVHKTVKGGNMFPYISCYIL